eukprot:384997_1
MGNKQPSTSQVTYQTNKKLIVKNEAARGKKVFILIRGVTNPPTDSKVSKRKDPNGNYLNGVGQDIGNMERWIQKDPYDAHFHQSVSRGSLTCKEVLTAIAETIQYAKLNMAASVCIYYTGHGQTNTGNWLFIDGAVSIYDINSVVCDYCGQVDIVSDCCFSGNWALELMKESFPGTISYIIAAAWPGQFAMDHPEGIGGLLTLHIIGKSNNGSWAEKNLQHLKFCEFDRNDSGEGDLKYCFFEDGNGFGSRISSTSKITGYIS